MKYKCCWLAREYRDGWTLAFSVNKADYRIPNIRFKDEHEVKAALGKNIVFVHRAGCNCIQKKKGGK